jgi:hypothetical protein
VMPDTEMSASELAGRSLYPAAEIDAALLKNPPYLFLHRPCQGKQLVRGVFCLLGGQYPSSRHCSVPLTVIVNLGIKQKIRAACCPFFYAVKSQKCIIDLAELLRSTATRRKTVVRRTLLGGRES